MSETKKSTVDERTPYVLEVDPIGFEADAEVKILTSNEFCKLVNEYFKGAFADYEGCYFNMIQGNPSVTLVFNHCKHEEGRNYAVEMAGEKKVSNSVIERSRSYDRLLREGDRYHITDDGKDIITKLLTPHYFNNGKPNWGNIVVEYTERPMYGGMQGGIQMTKVNGIDPSAMCAIIYGKKDEEGSYLDYGVEVKDNLSARNGNYGFATAANYVLSITRAYNEHIKNTYEKLGYGIGSGIIR